MKHERPALPRTVVALSVVGEPGVMVDTERSVFFRRRLYRRFDLFLSILAMERGAGRPLFDPERAGTSGYEQIEGRNCIVRASCHDEGLPDHRRIVGL